MSKLLIVESPAKAKTIGKYLGGDFTVKSSVGHVRDLPKKGGLAIRIDPVEGAKDEWTFMPLDTAMDAYGKIGTYVIDGRTKKNVEDAKSWLTVTEKAIQDAISVVIKGRTSFVIAHRLSTVVDADVILVVKDGKIIERGTHKELMKNKTGYYHALFSRQFEEMSLKKVENF